MQYFLKNPTGALFEYSLDQIRREFAKGKLSEDTNLRSKDSHQWQTLRQLLESVGDLIPLTEDELSKRTASSQNIYSEKAMRRYRDGYKAAHAINSVGGFVKFLGFIPGISIAVVGVAIGFQQEKASIGLSIIFTFFITGFVLGIGLFIFGVLVSAQGQLLLATLDDAVHSSPFMSESQKASAMSFR